MANGSSVLDGMRNMKTWIEENEFKFKPPVCNALMNSGQLDIMFVGGPNSRKDYHLEEGEEFFFMVKGDMCLKVMEKGLPKDVIIKEGEVFVLPSRIPHSPQRKENTIGLVIERERLESELDGLRYYCEDNTTILFEEWFHCNDLVKDLPPLIKKYKESEQYKTGKPIPGTITDHPPFKVDVTTEVHKPFSLKKWVSDNREAIRSGMKEMFSKGEFKINAYGGGTFQHQNDRETWIWQLIGESVVRLNGKEKTMKEDDVVIIPAKSKFSVDQPDSSVGLTFTMDPMAAKSI